VREIGYPDQETFHATFVRASSWLDAMLAESGVPSERTVLGGFSQGAVMSYALGLARGRPQPAALIALSGFIPTVDGLDLDLDDRRGVPVAIGHGTYDPVIEVGWGRQARELLEAAGAAVTYRESPLPHAVDPHFLRRLAPWVRDAVGRATAVADQ
jgi:phospholipase/carboxylesterase